MQVEKSKKVILVGKGATAKFFKKENHQDDILVAINQAALFIDYPDFIFANDVEGLQDIEEEKLFKSKNLAIPEYPHFKLKANPNITFKILADKAKNNLIIYNICSCPIPSKKYPYIDDEIVSTGDTAIAFFAKFYSIKHFELYGIAKDFGYHKDILINLNIELKKYSSTWDKDRLDYLKSSIKKLKDKYQLEIIIN